MNNLADIANDWLERAIEGLKSKYRRMGLKASGRWERELEGRTEQRQEGITVTILGTNYTYQLVHGRRPTAPQKRGRLYGVILQWVRDKGIKVDNEKRFAYLVARKIDERGIKVPNKYNDGTLLAELETAVDELKEQLQDKASVTVYSDVIKEFMR